MRLRLHGGRRHPSRFALSFSHHSHLFQPASREQQGKLCGQLVGLGAEKLDVAAHPFYVRQSRVDLRTQHSTDEHGLRSHPLELLSSGIDLQLQGGAEILHCGACVGAHRFGRRAAGGGVVPDRGQQRGRFGAQGVSLGPH
ncbi:MAG: hypothetical protein M3203_13850, partial [Actinomycetota bacterium]|nr:hypothetical protein [Actinomycetota bacterium]